MTHTSIQRPRRILHFASSFAPDYGGTTSRLLNLLPLVADTVHFLYVPVPAESSLPAQQDYGERLHVRRFKRSAGKPLPFALRSLSAVQDPDLDLVHGHNPATVAWASLLSARRRRIPFVYEAHRLSFDAPALTQLQPRTRRLAARGFVAAREALFFLTANVVIVQTERHKRRIQSLLQVRPDKIHVVPVHVDLEHFDPRRVEGDALRLRLENHWHQRTVLLYCGHLATTNGVMLLVRAVSALPKEVRTRVRLVVLGRGPLEGDVRTAAMRSGGLIEYHGLATFEAMPSYYRAADLVIVPSLPDRIWDCNQPTKALEGMAMQRPVLSSDIGGVKDLIREGHSGFLFKANEQDDLTERLRALIDGPDLRSTVGVEGRRMIEARHSSAACARLLSGAYSAAMSARWRPGKRANP